VLDVRDDVRDLGVREDTLEGRHEGARFALLHDEAELLGGAPFQNVGSRKFRGFGVIATAAGPSPPPSVP
jgi:hypothetical protein